MRENRGKLDETLGAMFSGLEYSNTYLFYAHMIASCKIIIDYKMMAPAGVRYNIDHYDLIINPTIFDTFTLVGRLAILQHEMLHILNNHIGRLEHRHFKTWNYSTDCAINQLIDKDHLPDVGILPETLANIIGKSVPYNKTAEQYYQLLVDNKFNENQDNGSGNNGSGNSSDDNDSIQNPSEMIDSHAIWEESIGDEELQQDVTKKMIEKSIEQTLKSAGNVPSECSYWLSLHTRKAEIDWKKVLRKVVGNRKVGKRYTIKKRNRRFPDRYDIKGFVKERSFNLLVIADVSGSMSDEAVLSTLSEVKHVCDVTKTDANLIQIDTEAYTPEKLSKNTKLITRKGHGGTRLYPAIERAKAEKIEFDAIVILTDGGLFGNDITMFENLKKKVIWLIEKEGTILDSMNKGKMKAFKLKE